MLKEKQKFKLLIIAKRIQEIGSIVFPRDKSKAFSSIYCRALDSRDAIFNLFRPICIFLTLQDLLTIYLSIFQGFAVLTNKSMLIQLSDCTNWFIDATLKVVPQEFSEILNMIVLYPRFRLYFPAVIVWKVNFVSFLLNVFSP